MPKPNLTSQWGRSLLLAPGVLTADGGTGWSADYDQWVGFIDVEKPTDVPGSESASYLLYLTASPDFGTTGFTDPGQGQFGLRARLDTGSGGVTRRREFGIPASGVVMQLGADSIRMAVRYGAPFDDVAPVTDDALAVLGWRVTANVSLSGMYPRLTQTVAPSRLGTTQVVVPIPAFSTRLRLVHPSPSSFDLQFVDQFGNYCTERLSGAEWSTLNAIPVPGFAVEVTDYLPDTASVQPMFEWEQLG